MSLAIDCWSGGWSCGEFAVGLRTDSAAEGAVLLLHAELHVPQVIVEQAFACGAVEAASAPGDVQRVWLARARNGCRTLEVAGDGCAMWRRECERALPAPLIAMEGAAVVGVEGPGGAVRVGEDRVEPVIEIGTATVGQRVVLGAFVRAGDAQARSCGVTARRRRARRRGRRRCG